MRRLLVIGIVCLIGTVPAAVADGEHHHYVGEPPSLGHCNTVEHNIGGTCIHLDEPAVHGAELPIEIDDQVTEVVYGEAFFFGAHGEWKGFSTICGSGTLLLPQGTTTIDVTLPPPDAASDSCMAGPPSTGTIHVG